MLARKASMIYVKGENFDRMFKTLILEMSKKTPLRIINGMITAREMRSELRGFLAKRLVISPMPVKRNTPTKMMGKSMALILVRLKPKKNQPVKMERNDAKRVIMK